MPNGSTTGPLSGLRLAVVDLLFSWPPNGGADVDLFHVMRGLAEAGASLQLYCLHVTGSWERGRITAPDQLPCPVHVIECSRNALCADFLAQTLEAQFRIWSPDLVLLAHGFTLKPLLLERLGSSWPVISRYYAHEMACLRDPKRFLNGAPCPRHCLRDAVPCGECATSHLMSGIRSGRWNAWTEEFVASGAWRAEWVETAKRGIRAAAALVVSNTELAREAKHFHPNVFVVPGGANVSDFSFRSEPFRASTDPFRIFMPGRCDDPTKGLQVFREAAALLVQRGFVLDCCCTHPDPAWSEPPVRSLGWLTKEETAEAYSSTHIVVVPSVWHEPFGLVAVEAMAAGKPVVASRSGGLADIIVDGETGLLVPPGDPRCLAEAIARLLSDPNIRNSMGIAGRQRVEEHYDWHAVIRRHYIPLLTGLVGK
ncbi:MAG TPA: glycosyltransferase family 4 protein [Candidatus Hydrogenedentes bacterium]|nr:glycosyltransferase family 4 protein [Candidatus Hydrogenedentota bacterium]